MTKSGWLDRSKETVFKSKKEDFDKAIVVLGLTREAYFAKKAAERSVYVLEKINAEPFKREKIAAAAFVIETVVEFERGKELEKLLMAKVEKSDPKTMEDMKAFALVSQGQEPWKQTESGYGVPLARDFKQVTGETGKLLDETMKSFIAWVGKTFDAEVTEIKNTKSNKLQFRKWILTSPKN